MKRSRFSQEQIIGILEEQEAGVSVAEPMDHRHGLQTVKPYAYEDVATLLADFWRSVDAVLKERGLL